jgi:hypothetical protein
VTGLRLHPISLRDANAFIEKFHRHHGGRKAHRFAISVRLDSLLVGVAICGNPVSKALCDGTTLEVSRTCTDGTPNANSMLYGACWRAARAMGYDRMYSYTLPEESGISLRAAGFRQDGMTEGRPWSRPKRFRVVKYPVGPKIRWVIDARQNKETSPMTSAKITPKKPAGRKVRAVRIEKAQNGGFMHHTEFEPKKSSGRSMGGYEPPPAPAVFGNLQGALDHTSQAFGEAPQAAQAAQAPAAPGTGAPDMPQAA